MLQKQLEARKFQMVQVFEIINKDGRAPVLLVCEHACNHVPEHFDNLGISTDALDSHIAWDPGALNVAKALSEKFDCPLFAAKVSRLVYDCNRPPEADDAYPAISEIFEIPGNKGLSEEEISWRVENIYKPFQAGLFDAVSEQVKRTAEPFLVTIHSFTPIYNGHLREVEIGILHDSDSRLADFILERASSEFGLNVKRNEPYSATDGVTYTLREHGLKNNLQNVMIEIRNDLISEPAGVQKIADALYRLINMALADHKKMQEVAKKC